MLNCPKTDTHCSPVNCELLYVTVVPKQIFWFTYLSSSVVQIDRCCRPPGLPSKYHIRRSCALVPADMYAGIHKCAHILFVRMCVCISYICGRCRWLVSSSIFLPVCYHLRHLSPSCQGASPCFLCAYFMPISCFRFCVLGALMQCTSLSVPRFSVYNMHLNS